MDNKTALHRPHVDVVGIHRDLAGYYRAFGLLDSSTPFGLFESVVWPHMTTAATASTASTATAVAVAAAPPAR